MTEQADGVPICAIVFHFARSYVAELTHRALEHRGDASDSVRDALNSAIANSVKLVGFRDASKAPVERLRDAVLEELGYGDSRLAAGVLRAWVESRQDLEDLVTRHLEELDIPADGPDFRNRVFPHRWDHDEWVKAAESIARSNGDLDEDDVAMMLCYVSGRMPVFPKRVADLESELLTDFLFQLDELPSDAPEWDELPAFARTMTELADRRASERHRFLAESLAEVLETMRADFEPELRYIGIDLASWNDQAAARPELVPDALDVARKLREELVGYRPVRPQADSREEEAARAAERTEREAGILRIAGEWRSLMSSPPVQSNGPSQADAEADERGEPTAAKGQAESAVSTEQHKATLADIERLRERDEALRAENDRLAEANAGLESDKRTLDDEASKLKDELARSLEMEQTWYRSYVDAMATGASKPSEPQPEPTTVNEAVARAGHAFPERLVFALNSKSEKNSQFQKPREVFDALAWLATVYYQHRVRPGKTPHFDKLLKEACSGWSYKAGQTEVTREQFSPWYATQHDGKQYDLVHHLAKGNSRDPKSTIRIAFAWDDERRQVIVGYIGRHQRNRRT